MLATEKEIESMTIEDLLSKGKEAYNASKYEEALIYLSKACENCAKTHGDMSDLMLEPHFYYAKSLYEYSKQEVGTLNDVNNEIGESSEKPEAEVSKDGDVSNVNGDESKTKVEVDETELAGNDDKEMPAETTVEDSENKEKAGKLNDVNNEIGGSNEKPAAEVSKDGDESKTKDGVDETELAGNDSKEKPAETIVMDSENKEKADKNKEKADENKVEESETEEENVEDDIEELSGYQLAYENIECAKVILKRQMLEDEHDKKDVEIKLADCHVVTGHILMEDDKDDDCLKEYEAALQIQLRYKDPRAIAEIYFYLGMACSNQYKWQEAKRYYEECKQAITKMEGTEDKAEFLATIDQRLEDVEAGMNQMKKAALLMRKVLDVQQNSDTGEKRKTTLDGKVNDLSSCVRKKPKLETQKLAETQ